MFRFSSPFFFRIISRSRSRYNKNNKIQVMPEANKVKIISTDFDDSIKISFKYGHAQNSQSVLTVKASKNEKINSVLARIKLMVNLQKKKEELRRAALARVSGTSELAAIVEDYEEEVNVDLLCNNKSINEDVENNSIWTQGAVLKIGDELYEISMNTPSIVELSLPEYILPETFIRPHFVFECAVMKDSEFSWYRSQGDFTTDVIDWVKVSDGFIYQTKLEDIGHKLKIVCKPKCGDQCGLDVSAVSKNPVETGPKMFPFEKRHRYTKHLVEKDSFRFVSYNVLANMYVEAKRFPYATKKSRDGYYRKQLLLKEIIGYNSDIICLQEVQERAFEYDLLPVLGRFGYQGNYLRKGGRRYEGLALFVRNSKFRIVDQQGIYLNEAVQREKIILNDLLTKVSGNYRDMSKLLAQDTALQIMLLEHVDYPEYKVLAANTHLYSNKDTPEVRLIQAALCTYYLEHVLGTQEDKNRTAFVFCGDFNSLPHSDAFQFLTRGSFECCTSWKNNASKNEDSELKHSLELGSACGIPEYTNFTEEFVGCLDYIFYGKNSLDVTDIVPMPNHDDVRGQIALPSEYFPSDHIALVCTLRWKHWNKNNS